MYVKVEEAKIVTLSYLTVLAASLTFLYLFAGVFCSTTPPFINNSQPVVDQSHKSVKIGIRFHRISELLPDVMTATLYRCC